MPTILTDSEREQLSALIEEYGFHRHNVGNRSGRGATVQARESNALAHSIRVQIYQRLGLPIPAFKPLP